MEKPLVHTKVNLKLVEIPPVLDKLQGTVLELEDCGFSNCGSILSTSDINEAAEDCDWALLVGSIPRGITINGKKIEERGDLLHVNGGIFTDQGNAIGTKGKEDAKILVVGNPANTNALIGKSNSNNNSQLWMAMTALDANRAKAQVSIKTNRSIEDIKGMQMLCARFSRRSWMIAAKASHTVSIVTMVTCFRFCLNQRTMKAMNK